MQNHLCSTHFSNGIKLCISWAFCVFQYTNSAHIHNNIICVFIATSSIGPCQRVGGALLFLACPSVCLSVHCCGHSNLVIFNRIFFKFHIWFASIKLWFKFQYEFCPTNDNQDDQQMAAAYQFASIRCCGHSNLVIFNWISSKFHLWFASIKPWFQLEYEFCQINYNQDG